jgi:hypothetical protein
MYIISHLRTLNYGHGYLVAQLWFGVFELWFRVSKVVIFDIGFLNFGHQFSFVRFWSMVFECFS